MTNPVFPLVDKYFAGFLKQLSDARENGKFNAYFVGVLESSEILEGMLERIEKFGQTRAILDEIGDIEDPAELDRRLLDAWAELRTIEQLGREGFESIEKTTEIIDLSARKGGATLVFQVTRIGAAFDNVLKKPSPVRDLSPTGDLAEIYARLEGPVSNYLWNPIDKKNTSFRRWKRSDCRRVIVIVSSTQILQDSLVRHIACVQIRQNINLLVSRHFDILIWLPDMGNGAMFSISEQPSNIECWADWRDELEEIARPLSPVHRRQVNLEALIPTWRTQ